MISPAQILKFHASLKDTYCTASVGSEMQLIFPPPIFNVHVYKSELWWFIEPKHVLQITHNRLAAAWKNKHYVVF